MFTGIIRAVSKVKTVRRQAGGLIVGIEKPAGWKINPGDSINVSGVCSTVKKTGKVMLFEYMPESLAKTNLNFLKSGSLVNLEQSLRASDRLDGHMVQGHVDTIGKIISITPDGNSQIFKIAPKDSVQMRLAAPKGSITIEGISLTIVTVSKDALTVNTIPYTRTHTNLHTKQVGETVNIEFDVLAKYLQQLIKSHANKK